jgi:hypothetical protein
LRDCIVKGNIRKESCSELHVAKFMMWSSISTRFPRVSVSGSA